MKCKLILRTFLIIMPICVALRTAQLFFLTDIRTGFLKPQYLRYNILLLALITLAFLLLAGVAMTVRRCPLDTPKVKMPLAVASFVFAIFVFVDSIFSFLGTSLTALPIIVTFFGVLCTFFLFVYAAKVFYPINVPYIFYAVPTIFCAAKLIINFASLLSLSSIIENALFIISLCCATVFFLEFARIANKVIGNYTHKILMVSGTLAATACLTFSLPQLLMFLMYSDSKLHHSIFTLILILTMGVFISFYLFRHFANSNLRGHKHSKSRSHSRSHTTFMGTPQNDIDFYLGR